jgi:uncharacterized protein
MQVADRPLLAVTPELYVVSGQSSPLLYAPLKGLLLKVKPALVERWEAAGKAGVPLHVADPSLFALFDELGLLDPATGPKAFPRRQVSDDFWPTGAILLLTSNCNLRCRYCYASGGERSEPDFQSEVAHAAIRLVVDNALRRDEASAHLAFHGGGEPTLNFSLLRDAVAYARSYARERAGDRLRVETSLVTNGIMPAARARWLAENIDSVQLSLDGPAALHDLQRPFGNGSGSHAVALRTARILQHRVPDMLIKATISRVAVPFMPEIAEFLCSTFDLPRFHLGPVLADGRARDGEFGPPEASEFVTGLLRAQTVADRYGRKLIASGAQAVFPQLRATYCGVTDPNFAVTVHGDVTSCYGVIYPDDPRAERFHYGGFDRATGRFTFDQGRLVQLRRSDVFAMPTCSSCFAKLHCAGDCQARFPDGASPLTAESDIRCEINRLLIRRLLHERLAAS